MRRNRTSFDRIIALCTRTAVLGAMVFACALPAAGQTTPATESQPLPLRRDMPDPVPRTCAITVDPAAVPVASAEDLEESARLATEASNAAILGDLRTAKDLLSRAGALGPTEPNIAFRLARTLESLGEIEGAVTQYCRYLSIAPEAQDAADIRELVTRIAPPVRPGIPDSALADLDAALQHADSGRLAEAAHGFTAVIGAAPGWAVAWYNRGVVRAALRQRQAARADLTRFLELEPDGASHEAVLGWIAQLDAPRTPYSPGTAFAAGLIPGVGHFYTGRPATGLMFLATAGGAVAAGVLMQTRHIECLGDPQGGTCPPDQVRSERVERPYMMVGLGVAAAASILGAIDAARGARSRNAQEPIIRFGEATAAGGDVGGAALLLPDVRSTGSQVDLALIRLRF